MTTIRPVTSGPRTIWDDFREGSEFFMQEGAIYDTLRRLAACLQGEGIEYALIDDMALVAHGVRRFTEDVDVLLTREALAAFNERLVGRGYRPAFSGATKAFRDAETGVKIEIVTTGEYPGDGKPKPVAFPRPADASAEHDGIRLIELEKLIELKLASGLSAPHRALRDLGDVQRLIETLRLPTDFDARLNASVRAEYRRLWELAQVGDGE